MCQANKESDIFLDIFSAPMTGRPRQPLGRKVRDLQCAGNRLDLISCEISAALSSRELAGETGSEKQTKMEKLGWVCALSVGYSVP